jgi:hypothetical protein
MHPKNDATWSPTVLTLEQVQAVLTHHREININFALDILNMCLTKQSDDKQAPFPQSQEEQVAVLPKVYLSPRGRLVNNGQKPKKES